MNIFEFVTFFIELIKLYMVVVTLLNNKIKSYKRFYSLVIVGGLINLIWVLYIQQDATMLTGVLVMFIVSVNLEYQPPVLRKYFLVIIMYWLISIIDSALATVVMFFGSYSIDYLLQTGATNLLVNSLSIFVFAFLILIKEILTQNSQNQNKVNVISLKSLVIILIIIINLGIYIFPLEMANFSDNEVRGKKLMVLAASFVSICFVVMVFQYYIQRAEKQQLEKEMVLNNKIYQCKENYYKMLMQKNIQTIEFRHDIKNHLYCMQLLLQDHKYEELTQYLDAMSGKMQKITKSFDVGNELVNAIILDEIGDERHISLQVKGTLPDKIRLKNIDLCTIFSNLFKNAVEAQAKLEDNKWIRLEISHINGFLSIRLQNSVKEDVKIKGNNLITSKKDKGNHGIGSRNVIHCINQYNGQVKYSCENHVFECQIIIPDTLLNQKPFTAVE